MAYQDIHNGMLAGLHMIFEKALQHDDRLFISPLPKHLHSIDPNTFCLRIECLHHFTPRRSAWLFTAKSLEMRCDVVEFVQTSARETDRRLVRETESFACSANKGERLFVSRSHRVANTNNGLEGIARVERLTIA